MPEWSKGTDCKPVIREFKSHSVLQFIAAIAVIEYNSNHWLLIPAGVGAFCGTWVGMKIRKKQSSV